MGASLLVPGRADAYIDPGTGPLIWQALFAVFVGALFYVRTFIRTVKKWFGVSEKEVTTDKETDTDKE